MKIRNALGVTLPELLVVLVIVGILSALAFGGLGGQADLQNLKSGQQLVFQALRSASTLAITKSRNVTVEFYPYTYATASLQNKIRICTNTATGPAACDDAAYAGWNTDPIKQEFIMPKNIAIRRAVFGNPCGSGGKGAIQFSPSGTLLSAGCTGTVYLSVTPAKLPTPEPIAAFETASLTTLEPLVEDIKQGAVYNAVTVSTILGKVRLVK